MQRDPLLVDFVQANNLSIGRTNNQFPANVKCRITEALHGVARERRALGPGNRYSGSYTATSLVGPPRRAIPPIT